MKKIIIIISTLMFLTACETVSNKTKNLKMPGSKCPEKGERTLKDILCRE